MIIFYDLKYLKYIQYYINLYCQHTNKSSNEFIFKNRRIYFILTFIESHRDSHFALFMKIADVKK